MYCGHGERSRQVRNWPRNWQGRQGSNLRQPVLETGTLPTELHPYGNQRHRRSAVSSIGQGQIARAKRLTPCSAPCSTPDLANDAKHPAAPRRPCPPRCQTGMARAMADPARRARPAKSGQPSADGAQNPVPHHRHDQADRLRRHPGYLSFEAKVMAPLRSHIVICNKRHARGAGENFRTALDHMLRALISRRD
jgi:hypothetical protein